MRISNSAYMGVETLVRLAVQSAGRPCTTQGLAEWINRSVSYTEGLMKRLRNAGLVVARHGPGGGYILARPADQITVAEVFQAVDEPSDLPSRAPSRALNAATLEPEAIHGLHGTDLLWTALKNAVLLFLDGVSLADLTPEAAGSNRDDGKGHGAICPADMPSTARH